MRPDMPYLGTSIKRQMCPTGPLTLFALDGHKRGMAGNNVAAIRKQRGLSQTELADRIGTTLNMLGKLERGTRTLDTDWLEKIARELDCDPRDLIAPSTSQQSDHTPTRSSDAGDTVGIVQLDLSLSMGPGTLIEDFVESEVVSFDASLLSRITRTPADRLRFVTGIGTSHEPKFQHNDQFLIDINERRLTRIDGYYWITFDGAHALKRLRPLGGGRVQVISDNPDYAPMDLDAREVRIEGRAVWFARGL